MWIWRKKMRENRQILREKRDRENWLTKIGKMRASRQMSREKKTRTSKLMRYKEYVALVEFDASANIFHGEVKNLHDVITFEGESVAELRQAFEDSVEDYLEFCKSIGKEPEKAYSGRLLVRVDPSLHREISLQAAKEDLSINQWVEETLAEAVEE
jgi:predicted HicB family RNase H-like nuclease